MKRGVGIWDKELEGQADGPGVGIGTQDKVGEVVGKSMSFCFLGSLG